MYGRSFDRKKRKTPRNTQTPHKQTRETGVWRGEKSPRTFFILPYCRRSNNAHRRSQRQRALRSRRQAQRQATAYASPLFGPCGPGPSGRENAPPFASPALPIMLACVKGSLHSFFTPLTLCANGPGDRRGASTGRKGGWKRRNDGHGPREEFPRMGANSLASLSRDTRTSPKKGNGPEEPPHNQAKAVTRSHKGEGEPSLSTLGSIIPNERNKEKERGDNVGTGKTRHRRMDDFDLRPGARESPVATLA